MPAYGNLPAIDLADAEVLATPSGSGEGHWVGAPCVHRHGDRTYLALRRRDPDRRGYAIELYEREAADSDGWPEAEFERVVELRAEDVGAVSLERPSLVTDPASGALKLYLPVEHGENDWTIQRLADVDRPTAFDPATANDVLVPQAGTTDEETVKDPYVVVVGGRYYMFYAGHDGQSEQAHLATSVDGENWSRSPANPILSRAGWHDHHTRLSAVLPAPDAPVWLAFYDGSGTADYGNTWNLRTGTAVSTDLAAFVDTSPDSPWLSAPTTASAVGLERFATCRYLDVLPHDPGWELLVEVAREDGAFELRRTTVAVS